MCARAEVEDTKLKGLATKLRMLLVLAVLLGMAPVLGTNNTDDNSDYADGDLDQVPLQTSTPEDAILRAMATDWEIVGADGVAMPRENMTPDVPDCDAVEPDDRIEGSVTALPAQEFVMSSEPGVNEAMVTPLTPAKDGHWFPRKDYSRLTFDFYAPTGPLGYKIHIELKSDQDTITRFFRVYVDGWLQSGFPVEVSPGPNGGYHGDVTTWVLKGSHTVLLEINYGALKEKGWKLLYFWVYDCNGKPMDVTTEYTYNVATCSFKYQVKLGPSSYVNLKVENWNDGYVRYCYVYVDGVLKLEGYAPGSYQFSIGSYVLKSVHEIEIRIWWSNYADYGKKITDFRVWMMDESVEIDYREDHRPDDAALLYWATYYTMISYHKPYYELDDCISIASGIIPDEMTKLQVKGLKETYMTDSREYDSTWSWCLFIHKFYPSEGCMAFESHRIIGMGDQHFVDWCAAEGVPTSYCRRSVLLHEFGHQLGIVEKDNTCPSQYCVYAPPTPSTHLIEKPTYCVYCWKVDYHPWFP